MTVCLDGDPFSVIADPNYEYTNTDGCYEALTSVDSQDYSAFYFNGELYDQDFFFRTYEFSGVDVSKALDMFIPSLTYYLLRCLSHT